MAQFLILPGHHWYRFLVQTLSFPHIKVSLFAYTFWGKNIPFIYRKFVTFLYKLSEVKQKSNLLAVFWKVWIILFHNWLKCNIVLQIRSNSFKVIIFLVSYSRRSMSIYSFFSSKSCKRYSFCGYRVSDSSSSAYCHVSCCPEQR